MILRKEIEKQALAYQVSRSTIDKDWALSHFIDAIFSIEKCRAGLVFKGGTCLRKCYIQDYRFSEDLDFTTTTPDFILDNALLNEIVTLVGDRTGMPLHIEKLAELKHNNQLTGFAAVVKFWGADHAKDQTPPPPERWTTSIKVEIIQYEKLIFPVVMRPVFHEYSDELNAATKEVPCYDIKEVLSEKIRALVQRSYTAPRDYYDIWYLSSHIPDLDWKNIVAAFYKKMKYKGLEFTGIEQLLNPANEKAVKSAWKNSLEHQINKDNLPEFETVKTGLEKLFERIF